MMRLVRPALAATALLAAVPAWACQYTQVPEPVGSASAPFFTGRMIEAAATVDIAVAGETRTAFGSDPRWGVPATTFHVIDRLKGYSPDRFTLFVGKAAPDSRDAEPMHWVDDSGRITPFPYPVEAEYAIGGIHNLNSCHPGTLTVRSGESYLVFRDGEGRLLGRFALYDDMSAAVFPLVEAGLGTREGWLAMIPPLASDKASSVSELDNIRPDRTRVRFPSPLTQREAQRWLQERGLRPFAVQISAGLLLDETRVPPEHASTGLVERALADARSNTGDSALRDLARTMLASLDSEALENDALLRRHAWIAAEAGKRNHSGSGDVLVAGFDLIGSPAAIARLRGNPGDVEVIDGPLVNGALRVGLSVGNTAENDAYWRETATSLLARLAVVAENRPIPEAVEKPPEPEPDPFSYMDCIRFGREEAARLVDLPEVGRLDDLRIFGDPNAAQCTTASGALSCMLAPNTIVRVIWAGWEGGFRVNPRGVTLTADGDGLRCGGG